MVDEVEGEARISTVTIDQFNSRSYKASSNLLFETTVRFEPYQANQTNLRDSFLLESTMSFIWCTSLFRL